MGTPHLNHHGPLFPPRNAEHLRNPSQESPLGYRRRSIRKRFASFGELSCQVKDPRETVPRTRRPAIRIVRQQIREMSLFIVSAMIPTVFLFCQSKVIHVSERVETSRKNGSFPWFINRVLLKLVPIRYPVCSSWYHALARSPGQRSQMMMPPPKK